MKVNKTQAVLYMYEEFLTVGYLKKTDIQEKLEIPDLTFARYICEIRNYLANFGTGKEIFYEKAKDRYNYGVAPYTY